MGSYPLPIFNKRSEKSPAFLSLFKYSLIFLVNLLITIFFQRYEVVIDAFVIFGLVPFLITGKYYLKSLHNNVSLPPISLFESLISYKDLSIVSYTYLCNRGLSSIMIAETYFNIFPSLLYFEIFKILSFYKFIGTLKALCTVYPFYNKVTAIPLVAVLINKILFDKRYVIILFNKNDLPIPPGPSRNIKPSV